MDFITELRKPKIQIMENLEQRTSFLVQHLKTTTGKEIAKNKIKLIDLFLNDYYDSII